MAAECLLSAWPGPSECTACGAECLPSAWSGPAECPACGCRMPAECLAQVCRVRSLWLQTCGGPAEWAVGPPARWQQHGMFVTGHPADGSVMGVPLDTFTMGLLSPCSSRLTLELSGQSVCCCQACAVGGTSRYHQTACLRWSTTLCLYHIDGFLGCSYRYNAYLRHIKQA